MTDKILLVINGIKKFAKYLVIPTGAVTFLPDHVLQYIRLLDVKNFIGTWIAIGFFLSLSIIIIDSLSIMGNKIKKIRDKCIKRKAHENQMICLTASDKRIIKIIYENDIASFDMSNASIEKLGRLQIVGSPRISQGGTIFSYFLQPWVLEWLRKNPNYFKEETPNGQNAL